MKKLTKKERVEQYLNRLMKGRYFKIEDLMSLSAPKIKENTAIMDISMTTINEVLGQYKKRYQQKSRSARPETDRNSEDSNPMRMDEIRKLRQIIEWFDTKNADNAYKYEELVSALNEVGIDYKRILDRYRKER